MDLKQATMILTAFNIELPRLTTGVDEGVIDQLSEAIETVLGALPGAAPGAGSLARMVDAYFEEHWPDTAPLVVLSRGIYCHEGRAYFQLCSVADFIWEKFATSVPRAALEAELRSRGAVPEIMAVGNRGVNVYTMPSESCNG